MDEVTLYLSLRADRALEDATVDALAGVLRTERENVHVWRDADSPTLLRVSVDCVVTDLDNALELGRELAALATGLVAEEVVAMTDEEQLVWRARP